MNYFYLTPQIPFFKKLSFNCFLIDIWCEAIIFILDLHWPLISDLEIVYLQLEGNYQPIIIILKSKFLYFKAIFNNLDMLYSIKNNSLNIMKLTQMKPKKESTWITVMGSRYSMLYWLKSENKRHNSCFSNVDKLHKHETHQNRAKKAKFRGLRSVYRQEAAKNWEEEVWELKLQCEND